MVLVTFDKPISLRKNEIIEISEGWIHSKEEIRANCIKNITSGQTFKIPRSLMSSPPQPITPPIVGKVVSAETEGDSMEIILEQGTISENFVFAKAGEGAKGIQGLKKILAEVKVYLKICDPFIDEKTIALLEDLAPNTKVSILCKKIDRIDLVKSCVETLRAKQIYVTIKKAPRKCDTLHGRNLFSESGAWMSDASLKHIGRSDSVITELPEKGTLEANFDDRFNNLGKNI